VERRQLLDHERGVLDRAAVQDVALPSAGLVLEQQDDTPALVVDGRVVEPGGELNTDLAVKPLLGNAALVVAQHARRIAFLHRPVAGRNVSPRHRQLRDQRGRRIAADVLAPKVDAADEPGEAVLLTDALPVGVSYGAASQNPDLPQRGREPRGRELSRRLRNEQAGHMGGAGQIAARGLLLRHHGGNAAPC
jgi:hypothetical protein